MHRAIRTFLWLAGLSIAGTGVLASPIQIGSGTYGANCGARVGNVTRELAEHCNTRDTCSYAVAAPAEYLTRTHIACEANFIAEWNCGAGEFHRAEVRAAGKGDGTLVLTCVPSTGAGK